MTMCGPACSSVFSSSAAPIATARIGTIHTSDSRAVFFFAITGSAMAAGTTGGGGGAGVSPAGGSVGSVIEVGILPDQARVEAARGQHREDHDRGERQQPGLGRGVR